VGTVLGYCRIQNILMRALQHMRSSGQLSKVLHVDDLGSGNILIEISLLKINPNHLKQNHVDRYTS